LLLSDSALEQWFDEDAVAYLQERYDERRDDALVIE